MWREVCAEAGLAFIVDNCTANGARKVATRYLDTGVLTPDAIKKGMRKLAHLITHSEKAQHYTLNALDNNVSRYIDVAQSDTVPTAPKRVLWDFVCNSCGATSAGYFPDHANVNPIPCNCLGCHGTMIPKKG